MSRWAHDGLLVRVGSTPNFLLTNFDQKGNSSIYLEEKLNPYIPQN